jgi:uncharacterized protein YigE (DUF2233 family)
LFPNAGSEKILPLYFARVGGIYLEVPPPYGLLVLEGATYVEPVFARVGGIYLEVPLPYGLLVLEGATYVEPVFVA